MMHASPLHVHPPAIPYLMLLAARQSISLSLPGHNIWLRA